MTGQAGEGGKPVHPNFAPAAGVTVSGGRVAWDTVEGCWYVVVEAKGYHTKISPLVGVPPEATDLDMVLTEGKVYLPVFMK